MNFIKKLFSLNALFATITLFILFYTVPLLFSGKVFDPFTKAVSDFQISDVFYSSLLPELELPSETEIVLINSVTFSPFGQKDVSSDNIARFVLMAQEAGVMAIGINCNLDLDSESEDFETIIEILSQEDIIIAKEQLRIDGNQIDNLSEELSNLNLHSSKLIGEEDYKHSTIRSLEPKINDKEHFAVKLASYYNEDQANELLDLEELFINYRGNFDKFTTLEAAEFFSGEYEANLNNKLVIIGDFDVSGISDEFSKTYYTPLNENTAGRTFPDMYHSMIQANIVSMIISNEELESYGGDILIIIMGFILGYLNMVLYNMISSWDRKWLEFAALIVFVLQSIGIAFLTVDFIANRQLHIELTYLVYIAALSPIIYQIYMDTIRPLSRRIWNLFT